MGGNLNLAGTLNVTPGSNFGSGTYTLLSYAGSETEALGLGNLPQAGTIYSYALNYGTGSDSAVTLAVTRVGFTWTGTDYTAGNNGMNYRSYDWSDPANWGSAGVPNAAGNTASIIVASPPGGWTQYIVYLSQSVTVGSLTMEANQSTNGGFGIYNTTNNSSYGTTTLTFQASSGDATLSTVIPQWDSTAVIQPNVVLNSPLDVNVFSNDPYQYGWTQVPMDFYGRYSHGLIFLGSISGTDENITKTGLGAMWLANPNSTFTGNINVQAGWLWANGSIATAAGQAAPGAYNNSIALGSAGQIGHLSFTDGRGFGTNALAAPISLAGEGGDLRVDGRDYVLDISSSISGGSSSAILLLGGAEGQMIFNNNPASTYAGRTIVQQHTVDVTSNNLTFTGNVEIDPIGNVFLAMPPPSEGPSPSVRRGPPTSPCPWPRPKALYLTTDVAGGAIANITSSSSGILGINCTSGSSINGALEAVANGGLGNGYMSYASCSGGVYTGTFLPCDADGVYRFVVTGANGYSNNAAGCLYSGAGLTLAAAGTTTGVLTGNTLTGTVNNSVVVSENSSMNAWNSLQWTTTKDANDFGGTLSVYPGAGFAGYAQPASASYTVAGGSYSASPFGTAGGAINLYAGGLKLYGQSGGLPVNKGALNFQGTSYVGLNGGSVYVASLTFASVNRVNNGVLIVDFQTGSAGAGENFIDANYANDFPVNNGMVAPWAVTYYSNGSFLTYNAAKGLQPAAFTNTNNLPNAGPNDIVQLTSPSGTVLSQSQEIYALSIYGYPFSSNSSSNTLTIDSGGLIVWAGNDFNDNVNITFGNSTTCAEGVIYTNWNATFSGNLTANNGLTIAGSINGFGFNCTLTGNNTIMSNNGAAPGTLTIDGGAWVQINSASAIGGSATTVYINGGGGDSNIQLGAGPGRGWA